MLSEHEKEAVIATGILSDGVVSGTMFGHQGLLAGETDEYRPLIGHNARFVRGPGKFSATDVDQNVKFDNDQWTQNYITEGLEVLAVVILMAELHKIRTYIFRILEGHANLKADVSNAVVIALGRFFDPDDYGPEDALPDVHSFDLMSSFFESNPKLLPPRLALSRNGSFIASWRESRNKLTSLEFFPNGMVGWLVFAPSRRMDGVPERAAGDADIGDVLDRIGGFGAEKWIERAT